MSKIAYQEIRRWRKIVKERALEAGLLPPIGRQNEGHDAYTARKNLAMSRVGECQVYSGRRIPTHPSYLNVEVHISMLNLGEDREPFRLFVFRKLRTPTSMESKRLNKRYKEQALLLVDLLNTRGSVSNN